MAFQLKVRLPEERNHRKETHCLVLEVIMLVRMGFKGLDILQCPRV